MTSPPWWREKVVLIFLLLFSDIVEANPSFTGEVYSPSRVWSICGTCGNCGTCGTKS